jgi:hypothetical protein
MNLNDRELNRFVRNAMFAAAACPDGVSGMACVSCMADMVTQSLLAAGYIAVSDPSARVQGPTNERY